VASCALVLAPAGPARASDCSKTSTGMIPIDDLGPGTYLGEEGGLYPGGSNARPASQEIAGQVLANAVVPRDASGAPDPSGKYALVSIGISNARTEFEGFVDLEGVLPGRDPHLVVVNGAQGGVTGDHWANPGDKAWAIVDKRLAGAGLTPQQVGVAWVEVADQAPTSGWPAYAQQLQGEMAAIARNLRARYPNLRLAYYTSRLYAGYATIALNPEPYAYESGFSVKWLLADQLAGVQTLNDDPAAGPVVAPWLAWGPYTWADGLVPRGDGLVWACSDFIDDGTHPSAAGRAKAGQLLLDFFTNDSTARRWFLADGPGNEPTVGVDCTGATGDGDALVEAIHWANVTREPTTLALAPGCTYTLTAPYGTSSGPTPDGLPPVTGSVTIDGNGATIARAAGAPSFRIMEVRPGGTVGLDDVAITGGRSPDGAAGVGDGSGLPGGGISNDGVLDVVDGAISGNAAGGGAVQDGLSTPAGAGGSGGGIANTGTLSIVRSTVSGNVAGPGGDGSGDASAGGPGGDGGGIANAGGAVTVVDGTVGGNSAGTGGSGLVPGPGGDGGGITNTGAFAIVNSTVAANVSGSPGAGPAAGTEGSGGGIRNGGTLTLDNSIVAENSAPNCDGDIASAGSSQHDLTWPDTDTSCPGIVGDPLLGPLADNGGPTETMALGEGSAAIDAGDDAVCAAAPPTGAGAEDQRGVSRTAEAPCDIGAYERSEAPSPPGTPALDGAASPNQGSFALGWDPSVDPQDDPLTYALQHRADTPGASFSDVATGLTGTSYSFGGASPPEQEGTWTYRVLASDGVHSGASEPSDAVTVDRTSPSVTVEQAATQADPTGVSPIHFTVAFSEPVSAFGGAGVALGGTAGPSAAEVTGIGTTFDVAVSGMSADGTITVSVPAGAATDAAGNPSLDSTSGDDLVAYDATPPQVELDPVTTPSQDSTPSFSGSADPGLGDVTIDVWASSNIATSPLHAYAASVDGVTGSFVATVPDGDALPDGRYTVQAWQADAAGNVGRSIAAPLTIAGSLPSLSIDDVVMLEGDAGETDAVFHVTLSGAAGHPVTVNASTEGGSATSGGDFTPASVPLTFDPGTTSLEVRVPVTGDVLHESNETFNVVLGSAVGATPADATGKATIVDEEGRFSISVGDASVTEGNADTTAAMFSVSLSAPPLPGETLTVTVATVDGTATAAGTDYVPAQQQLVFTLETGQTQVVAVQVNGDTAVEPNEGFDLKLFGSSSNASIADSRGTATIVNDDGKPGPAPSSSLALGDATVLEGDSGHVTAAFEVTLSPAATKSITVDVATANATAMAGTDYVTASQTLTFAPGETTLTFDVPVVGDLLHEGPETFLVKLSSAKGAHVADAQGTGTIVDEEGPFVVSVSDVTLAEGDAAGTTVEEFVLALSAGPIAGEVVSVRVGTVDGTAVATSDYGAVPPTTVTWHAGDPLVRTIDVIVNGDGAVERNETLSLTLSAITGNVQVADPKGLGTIVNDD